MELNVYCFIVWQLFSNISSTEGPRNFTEEIESLFVKGVDFPSDYDLPLLNRKMTSKDPRDELKILKNIRSVTNYALQNCGFGRHLGTEVEVYKGTRVSIREHPYIVSIRRLHSHYLTGTLLSKNVVVTVAHPLVDVPITDLKVVVGENYNDRGTMLITVLVMVVHQDFDANTLNADLALLRVFEDVSFRISVKLIRFLPSKTALNGSTAFVTGWGRCDKMGKELCLPRSTRYFQDEITDPMLRTVKFTINTNAYCEPYYRNSRLKNGMICVGESRVEDWLCPCMAVPGAPLIVDAQLAGILSWGFGCGYANDLPLVYTSVQYYEPWLEHNLMILRNIKSKNLTDIFDTTRAHVLSQWLVKTRMVIPVLKILQIHEMYPLDVDLRLSSLKGTVYDIRDFIFAGHYRKLKSVMYDILKGEVKKMRFNSSTLEMELNKTAPSDDFLNLHILDTAGLPLNATSYKSLSL